MKNNGRDYEDFVKKIHDILLNYDGENSIRNINIEKNKKIIDRCGVEREFDLYWEFSLGGYLYKTVIECKDYSSSISIDKIDSFIGKLHDFPNLRGIYATKTGYQKGAEVKAKQHNIDLLVVRETNDSDWVNEDGEPYLKTIVFKMKAITQPSARSFNVMIDKTWFDSQTNIDESQLRHSLSRIQNNEVIIENDDEKKNYTLQHIGGRIIAANPELPYGMGQFIEKYDNGFLTIPKDNLKVKIKALIVDFVFTKPFESTFEIDFAEQILGIVMNYQDGTKKTILKNGMIK